MSTSDEIAALGVPLTLTDGRVVTIRYGFRAAKNLEDKYGTIQAALQTMAPDNKDIRFGAMATILAAGVWDSVVTEDALLDLLDLRRAEEYAEVISRAIDQAFGQPDGSGKAQGTDGSPGATSTSSPPSATAEVTTTSGG